VVHPPSTMRSKRVPERERWKFVAQVCRSMSLLHDLLPYWAITLFVVVFCVVWLTRRHR
jgi:hypothetical protein